jgi:hypothetical protein
MKPSVERRPAAAPAEEGKKPIKDSANVGAAPRRTVVLDKSVVPEDMLKPGRTDS